MQVAHTIQQCLLERAVTQLLQVRDQILLCAVQEPGSMGASSVQGSVPLQGPHILSPTWLAWLISGMPFMAS